MLQIVHNCKINAAYQWYFFSFLKGRPDVRMAYVQFALSFLIAGDNAILVQVLELKGISQLLTFILR